MFDFRLADATLSYDSIGRAVISAAGSTNTLSGFERFQFTDGSVQQTKGSALVDDLFYAFRSEDVFAAGVDAEAHYDAAGWKEGRDPSAFFSTSGYLGANGDVKAAGINPLDHYEAAGWREGRDASARFDTTLYLQHNPDVKVAGIDPLTHYLGFGRAEGRETYAAIGSPASFNRGSFDAEFYLLSNADVARAAPAGSGATAFAYEHYQAFGWREGRDPNAYFDVKGYLNIYVDVKAAGIDPLAHYDQYGWREYRDPSGRFDTLVYVSANPDVAAAKVNPLLHYLQAGVYEDRLIGDDGFFLS